MLQKKEVRTDLLLLDIACGALIGVLRSMTGSRYELSYRQRITAPVHYRIRLSEGMVVLWHKLVRKQVVYTSHCYP